MYCSQYILMFSCRKFDTRRTCIEWLKCFISTIFINRHIWGFLPMKTRKNWSVYSSCQNNISTSPDIKLVKKTEKLLCSLFLCHFFFPVLDIWESEQIKNPRQLQWGRHTACKNMSFTEPQIGARNSPRIWAS